MDIKNYKPRPNWNGLTKWMVVYSKMVISCCDCGLAHEFWFREIKGKLMFKAKRHKTITKMNREKENYIKVDEENMKTIIRMLEGATKRKTIVNYIKDYVYYSKKT